MKTLNWRVIYKQQNSFTYKGLFFKKPKSFEKCIVLYVMDLLTCFKCLWVNFIFMQILNKFYILKIKWFLFHKYKLFIARTCKR